MKLIEILIGLVLVYALLSIIISVLLECRNSIVKSRGKMLRRAIFQMLDDSLNLNYGYLLLNHPLITSMQNKGENRPAQYLDSGLFADALIDIIGDQAEKGIPVDTNGESDLHVETIIKDSVKEFEAGLLTMKNSPMKKMLAALLAKSGGKYENLKEGLEHWYEANMDRATGWYKRKQRWPVIVISFVVAFLLNIDSIHLFRVISLDDELRTQLVLTAEKVEKQYSALDTNARKNLGKQLEIITLSVEEAKKTKAFDSVAYITLKNQLNKVQSQIANLDTVSAEKLQKVIEILDITSELGIPIGYNPCSAPLSWSQKSDSLCPKKTQTTKLGKYLHKRNTEHGLCDVLLWLTGILISGFMLSMGAPFWFETLSKFVNIRRAGAKPLVKTEKTQS